MNGKRWLFNFSRLLVLTVCKLYFRIEFEGVEKIPSEGAMILAPNHVSYLDPFWVSIPVKRPMRYMTWDRMTRLPLLGSMMKAYGAFPVNQAIGDRAAFRLSLEQLRSGGGLVIFPEGSRTRTGMMAPFKAGVIRLALETNALIVPVTIIGGYRAYSPYHLFPRPYKLKIIYHNPIHLSPPASSSLVKKYIHEQAEYLQSLVGLVLPADELPESKAKLTDAPTPSSDQTA